MSATDSTSYDLIPYLNYSFPQTHPDRLATLALLLGLSPQPVENCRVLELGCAAGSNLIPMAEELPHSTFAGIDLSRTQIDEGRKAIAELGLSNIELRHQSILDFEPGSEVFDYILCHGVYSWVPPEVQDRILAIAQHSLRPNGIAYISYNTLPGWHMRGMIRDMMLYHGRRFSDPHQQIAQARGLLDFLASSVNTEQNPYGQFLRSELESIRQSPDAYLFHDHLEEHNNPLYFHQFIERATAHRLRYLADVDLNTMEFRNFPQEVGQVLERVSNDLIQLEQYMDFLRNRTFRQTLLCNDHHTPNYRMNADVLASLFVGSALRPTSPFPDLRPSSREDFRGPTGASAYSIYPIVKASLLALGEVWPRFLSFPELCSRAQVKLHGDTILDAAATEEYRRQIGHALLQFYTIAGNLVEFRTHPLAVTTEPGPQPLARSLARWQAKSGRPVTNYRHEFLILDEFARQTLLALDGRHTRADVVRHLVALVEGGQLTVRQNGEIVAEPLRVEQSVLQALERQIALFARQALLSV